MDYPLHYTEENTNNSTSANNNQSNQYRPYVFNDNSIMFNNTSPTVDSLKINEDGTRSTMVMNNRSTQLILQDPWGQHQLLNTNEFNTNDILHHQNLSHSERGIAGFVSKLYQCLQSTNSSQKYARWCQHDGKDMFIIDCIPEFTEVVLPRLFKHCKFPSFVRQLNIYGFQRDTDARKSKDTKDKESCRWYHPCFRPGRRDLFHLIRRKATRYSRKKRAKTEEDPETILNLGSGDETEAEEENVVLIVNSDQNNRRCSSSASSVNQSMQPIDYNNSSSQLQLGFEQNIVENTVITEESDNADEKNSNINNNNNNNLVNMHPQDVMMREELKLQIYHMKRQYERMHNHFEDQLSTAQIQIEEQQVRIQQLENILRLTKNTSVKLNSSSGYMNTIPNNNSTTTFNNNFIQPSPSRLLNQRSLYTTTKNGNSPPTRTIDNNNNNNNNQFYFNDKIKIENNENHDNHHLLHTPPPPPESPQISAWNSFHRHQHQQQHHKNVSAGSNNNENSNHLIDNDKSSTKSQHMNFNSYNNSF